MKKEKEEKPASNFELNLIKIGIHRFQLYKGDRFVTNGSFFAYQPSTSENKRKIPFSGYSRPTTIGCEKYKKDVLRADNIKLVVDKELSEGSKHQWQEYEVQYAYTVPEEEREPIVCITLELKSRYVDEKRDKEEDYWKITHEELEIERETKVYVYVKKSPAITYMNQVEQSKFNVVQSHYGQQYILCKVEDAIEMEHRLVQSMEELQKSRVETAKQLLAKNEQNLNKFFEFKKTVGY